MGRPGSLPEHDGKILRLFSASKHAGPLFSSRHILGDSDAELVVAVIESSEVGEPIY
jgi:hypothetical protein